MLSILSTKALKQVTGNSLPRALVRYLSVLPTTSGPNDASSTIGANNVSLVQFRQMFQSWKKDPQSVENGWNNMFAEIKDTCLLPKGLTQRQLSSAFAQLLRHTPTDIEVQADDIAPEAKNLFDTLRIYQLVRAYEVWGFLHAQTDPLNLPKDGPYSSSARKAFVNTKPSYRKLGFTDEDLDKTFDCRIPDSAGFLSSSREPCTLRELVNRLEQSYCGSIGVEFMHIADANQQNFIRERFETEKAVQFSDDFKKRILIRTMRAQLFENFCAQKFSTAKRFGSDGCESMIVVMKEITKRASANGVNSVVVGMAHRGRLNFLMNCMHKPMPKIINEFKGLTGFGKEEWGSMGDVKYHMGVEFDHFDVDSQRYIHMAVLANPSHLEAVDPLVCGHARAQQYYRKDATKHSVLPVMFHGDASFAGQGIVYETLQMSQLPAYTVGGTIHIIVNNQIGFTTNVEDAGSGVTCTALSRSLDAPVFHVNADDPEAVTRVGQIAFDYRQQFGTDVFINVIGYRRFGHNELDMPKFTQPAMCSYIDKHKPVLEIYKDRLLKERVIDQKYFDDKKKVTMDFYNEQYDASKTYDATTSLYEYSPQWMKMNRPQDVSPPRLTGLAKDRLIGLGTEISTLPDNLTPHPTIGKLYKNRLESLKSGKNVDFGLAEALAYGSLLQDGFHVRLAGQDAQRGTFSHRHAVVHDQVKHDYTYSPLGSMKSAERFEVYNSFLSEYAALGFEVGYSLENPNAMVIWEAQFGDFANGCQIIIDQFIASGEVKWSRQCGITMLLPHGYDGQGPEHSSARIERFLQLCDDREDAIHPENWDVAKRSVIQKHNMQVVIPSTPANHFHVLRRQMTRGFRKPLIVFTPKKLLKLRAAVSDLSEMADGTRFSRYIPDTSCTTQDQKDKVKRLVACSGQLYYDLAANKEKMKNTDVVISRVEQLSPFPFDMFIDDIKTYPNLQSVVWAQEEPMNAGPWPYVSKRIMSSLDCVGKPNGISHAIFVGRDVSGAPAGGDAKVHQHEQDSIVKAAFDHNQTKNLYYENYMPK